MPSRPVLGLAVGRPALGVSGESWTSDSVSHVAEQLGFDVIPVMLDDAAALADLWRADAVVLICDGAYPEAGCGVTLAALHSWCSGGGVLVEIAASAFLLADSDGTMTPAVRSFMDVFDLVVDYNCTEQRLAATDVGRILLPTGMNSCSLLDVNRGSDRRTTLNSIPNPHESYLESAQGAVVLGVYAVGRGWLIRWGAAATGPWSDCLRDVLLGLARNHVVTKRDHDAPAAIVGRVLSEAGQHDVVGFWIRNLSESCLTVHVGDSLVLDIDSHHPSALHRVELPHRVQVAEDIAVFAGRSQIASGLVVSSASRPPAPLPRTAAPRIPADFVDFWRRQVSKSSARWHRELTSSVGARHREVVLSRVSCLVPGAQVAMGALCRPRHIDNPSPAILVLPGYSCSGDEEMPERWAELGLVGLSIGFGDVAPCGGRAGSRGLLSEHPDNPELFGYKQVVLMCLAAVEYLRRLPYVDPTRIAILGSSQGGGLALLTAAIDRHITAVAALVPFLCDIMRSQDSVTSEPSAELRRWLAHNPHQRDAVTATMQYYDAANAATLLDIPTLLMYAPNDELVHPTAVKTAIERIRPTPTVIEAHEGHIAPALSHHHEQVQSWLLRTLSPGRLP